MHFIKKKRQGYILLEAALAMIVVGMLSTSIFTIFSGQFSMIQASRTALAAQQYAEIDANTLRLLSYDDLDNKGAHARQGITSVADADGWQDEIVVGAEKTIDADAESKQRIATIKIYKTGDTLSRYSLQVPLSSQDSGIPKGTIIAWYGDLSNIPSSFKYCDGSNSTPDLRGRTIIGSGAWNDIYGSTTYSLGDTGGERLHKLTVNEMARHSHGGDYPFQYAGFDASGDNPFGLNGWDKGFGISLGDNPPYNGVECLFKTSNTGGDQPHNVMMPYMTLHWIMKK